MAKGIKMKRDGGEGGEREAGSGRGRLRQMGRWIGMIVPVKFGEIPLRCKQIVN